jgi:hypothetical protein
VKALDYEALCGRETLHGRGLAGPYCDQPVLADSEYDRLSVEAKRPGVWLPKRAASNFAAWLKLMPTDAGVRREIDTAPWIGMPVAMLDDHTAEGWRRAFTCISGDVATHRRIGERVMTEGWALLRAEVHGVTEPEPPLEQLQLEAS